MGPDKPPHDDRARYFVTATTKTVRLFFSARRKKDKTCAASRTVSACLAPTAKHTPVPVVTARSLSIANRHPRLRLDRRAVARAIHVLDAHAEKFRGGPPPGDLSLVLLTDAALAKLHADFLADPSTTDVITFEGDSAFRTAGEICVSVDAALRHVGLPLVRQPHRATARRPAPALRSDFSAELTLYFVHGWLHLAGYDDLVPAKKRVMRRAEARAMKLLREADCLPTFRVKK